MQATSPAGLPQDYTVEQVAEALQMSERWVRQRIAEGAAHQRYGHKIRMTAAQVEALRRSLESVPVTAPITASRSRRAS